MAFKIYYHTKCEGFYGRAFSAYAMLKHSGTPFTCHGPDEIPQGRNPIIMVTEGIILVVTDVSCGFAPPMVQFPAGFTIAQTAAINAAVGRSVGLDPMIDDETAKCNQLLLDSQDLADEMMGGKPGERIAKWMEYFESALGDTEYFMGDGAEKLSFADFGMFPVFWFLELKHGLDKWGDYQLGPKMTAWYDRMKANPTIAEMMSSGIAYLPPQYM